MYYGPKMKEPLSPPFLSDVIPVRVPFYHGNVFSLGDVLIASGAALLVFQGMRTRSGTGVIVQRLS